MSEFVSVISSNYVGILSAAASIVGGFAVIASNVKKNNPANG